MNYREIPEGSVLIQEGLYLYSYTRIIGGREYTFRYLYSAEGYVFYNLDMPENYDEEGNLLPANERTYATYGTTVFTTVEEINTHFTSVPYEEGYNVLNVPNNPEHEAV
jgi:hypothetical protein